MLQSSTKPDRGPRGAWLKAANDPSDSRRMTPKIALGFEPIGRFISVPPDESKYSSASKGWAVFIYSRDSTQGMLTPHGHDVRFATFGRIDQRCLIDDAPVLFPRRERSLFSSARKDMASQGDFGFVSS